MSDQQWEEQRDGKPPPSPQDGGEGPPPSSLFPLDRLLQELLQQEEVLWQRNEMHLQSLRAAPANPPPAENGDVSSVKSMGTSHSPAPTPVLEEGNDLNQAGLHIIRYGKLTNTVHKHFWRLEKRYACLYLTSSKARHQRLRHVGAHGTVSSEEGPPEVQSATALLREGGQPLVVLRDEELLVYRCALMCSQFPMLSAPSPPEGHSPTPTPPTLPLRFHPPNIGSLTDGEMARTAPDEYLSAVMEHESIGKPAMQHQRMTPDQSQQPSLGSHLDPSTPSIPPAPTTPPQLGRTSSGNKSKVSSGRRIKRYSTGEEGGAPSGVARTSSGEQVKSKPRGVDAGNSPESPKAQRKPLPSETMGHPVSNPIPIRGDHKSKNRNSSLRISRGKGEGEMAATKKLANKRLSLDGAALVSAVGSDEEDEMVKLISSSAKPGTSVPSDREHPFSPMVNREMLCNLVRSAFHQTEEQQLHFEQILRHEYGRRSKGEILAKELAGQLQVLENNAHPFYKPKFFVTRNGYDIWLQAEKQRVRSLIDKFWHFSLPRPQLWRHYNPTDYHRAYTILLQKIICVESRTERREPVHTGRTPSAPLSPTARRLLKEFGLRYGVGVLYRRIVYLDYLAKHFDYEIWYIKHCTEELRRIRELLPRNRNKITAVRKEMELLRSTVHLLHGQTDNSLTRIDRLFHETDPKEGVVSLIELLAEVLDAEQSLFGKKVRPVDDWLRRYLKSGFVLRYERKKEIAADEALANRTAQPFVLTAPLVNALLLGVRDEVREYREKFQFVFRPYFDIVPYSKVEFYRLLCADACSLCARVIHRPETRHTLSLEMLGLMYRMNERDIEWENVISPELQQWRRQFVDLALIWLEVLGKQINQWILKAIAEDQWTMLMFSHAPTPQGTNHLSPRMICSPQILAGMRNSPFPSPTSHVGLTIVKRSNTGAFLPYHRTVLKRSTVKSPVQSESSGAVTDITNSTSVESAASIPVEDIPDLIFKMAKKEMKNSPPDSLLKFGTGGVRGRQGEGLGFSSTVDPPEDTEAIGSAAYESYGLEQPDSKSPNQESKSPAEITPVQTGNGTVIPEPDTVERPEITALQCSETQSKNKAESVGAHTESQDDPLPKQGNFSLGDDHTVPKETQEDGDSPGDNGRTDNISQDTTASFPIDVIVKVVSPVEHRSQNWPTKTEGREGKRKTKSGRSQNLSQKHETVGSNHHPSQPGDVTDPTTSLSTSGTSPIIKFGNILDSCTAEGTEVVVPKPKVVKPSESTLSNAGFGHGAVVGEFHALPASVGTGPEVASWAEEHARDTFLPNGYSGSGPANASSFYREPQDIRNESPLVEVNTDAEVSSVSMTSPSIEEQGNETATSLYRFPVSSSPVDIVTMLTRLATFTGMVLKVLTPKLKRHTVPLVDQQVTHEYPSEVATARQQTMQQWKLAEDMKTEFLKKLHKTMVNSLKLYADNLLCMDLCCWSGGEANKMLGEQMVHHLRRRKEMGEIWGCRHMVEARHGLHPLGIPCQRKSSTKFNTITRDMCIRINNIHTLITIFSSLESHLHASSRTEVLKPTSTFGYISSDVHELGPHSQHLRPNTHTRLQPTQLTHLQPPSRGGTGSFSCPSSASLGLMEPDERSGQLRGRGERDRPEVGFNSRESLQALEYLKNVQRIQLRMLCVRMNKFFKPALSLLLELKLGDCSIEKRLYPLITFLARHRSALQKYIYPECFSTVMQYMWSCILQDLEEEAVKLRKMKKPVTDRAQMILQAYSHFVKFMHDRSNGVDLDSLTLSSEYLLGLLDIMTRSTDQLIFIFNKLGSPHFSRSRLDLSQSPIPVDSGVLHTLRAQLHTYKKCFTGKEFVDKILDIGRQSESRSENPSDGDTTDSQASRGEGSRNSSRLSSRVISSTGRPIMYTVRYATEVAQYLLNKRILLPLPDASLGTGVLTPPLSSEEEGSTPQDPRALLTSVERTRAVDTTRPLRQGSKSSSDSPHLVPRVSPLYPRSIGSREQEREEEIPAPDFSYSSQTFYKFADLEDFESRMLYQSQILTASSKPVQGGTATADESSEFHRARNSTLFLVLDLVVQRARKEKRAKQFLMSPRALTVLEQRKSSELSGNCDMIFKM